MIEYSIVIFEKFVEVIKVFIPLYICFDLIGDMLWRK